MSPTVMAPAPAFHGGGVTMATSITNVRTVRRQGLPASIPRDQLYFWTTKWQSDEMIATAELARGEGRVFNSARDAISWLLDVSDDE